MIVLNPIDGSLLKDPVEISKYSQPDFIRLQLLAQYGKIIFKIPAHVKTNKDKRIYKVGFLNEFYVLLFKDKKKTDIYHEVTECYQIFIEQRQYQIDVKDFKQDKYTKFVKDVLN